MHAGSILLFGSMPSRTQTGRRNPVVDVHREVLSRQLTTVRGTKAQALTDEARLMLVKLLCYLSAYYRRFAVGH